MNPPFSLHPPSTSAVAGAKAVPAGAAVVVAVVPTAPVVAGLAVAVQVAVEVAAAAGAELVAELGAALAAGPAAPAVPVAGGLKHRSGAVARPS